MYLLELAVRSSSGFWEYFFGKALENEAAHFSVGRMNIPGFSCNWRELAPGLCGRLGFHLQLLCASTSLRALLVCDLFQPEKFTSFSSKAFLKIVWLLRKVIHRLREIAGLNSRNLGDEEWHIAFNGASDQLVPYSCSKAWSDLVLCLWGWSCHMQFGCLWFLNSCTQLQ